VGDRARQQASGVTYSHCMGARAPGGAMLVVYEQASNGVEVPDKRQD
jgi:hypothetical protein